MKQLGWIALTLVLAVLSMLMAAWPDLQELRRGSNWNLTETEENNGELDGVTVTVHRARAMIFPAMPDRALVYLRLGLGGERDRMRAWLICDLALTDGQGRVWRPLGASMGQVIELLGDQFDDYTNCSQSLAREPEHGDESMSVQAFLVPAETLSGLRLRISGMTTRPDALSLPFRPALRPPPAGGQ